jgi:hypothetical protein
VTRADVCPADDYDTRDRLFEVIRELGGRGDDGDAAATGVQRFRFGADEVTVFADSWAVDVAGPDELVRRILAAL